MKQTIIKFTYFSLQKKRKNTNKNCSNNKDNFKN